MHLDFAIFLRTTKNLNSHRGLTALRGCWLATGEGINGEGGCEERGEKKRRKKFFFFLNFFEK